MDVTKVKALYDFAGEPGSAELTIHAGQVLQVTRRDVGEGWWEGTNNEGITGLFPAAYVEEVSTSSVQHAFLPHFPATPPVGATPVVPSVSDQNAVVAGSPDGGYGQADSYSQQALESQDFWDDEWDDDSEGGSVPRAQASNVAGVSQGYLPGPGSMGDDSAIGKGDGKATVRRNLNRFSNFVKSGGESYVLGTVKVPVTDVERIFLQETDLGIIWCSIGDPYSCIVASPKKESKLKGLKSFIAYQLTPTFNNIQVSRRYKHFDWLHERLEEKFSLIPIPPLPDKQISGRYEEMFIEHRRVQLQAFVDYVCKHPVLSQCWVWQHFITCTDEKRWKAGKRRAEKDELVGANFFLSLKVPEKVLDSNHCELRADHFHRYVHEMDLAVKNLMTTAADQAKKHQGPYKREFQRVGQSFLTLAQAACIDDEAGEPTSKLGIALRTTGETYMSIGKLFEDQPKSDWEPLSDVFHIYRGILSSYPDNLSFHKSAIQKRRECEKLSSDNKMDTALLTEVTKRTDVVSYALLAEINHYYSESSEDLNKAMRSFLIEQIAFYEKVVNKLKETLTAFDV